MQLMFDDASVKSEGSESNEIIEKLNSDLSETKVEVKECGSFCKVFLFCSPTFGFPGFC